MLLVLAAPFLGMRFGFPDAQNNQPAYTTHKAYGLLSDGFGPGFTAPLVLVVQGAEGDQLLASTDEVATQLREVHGVASVSPATINEAGDAAVLRLTATTSPQRPGHRRPRRHPARHRRPRRHRRHRPHG